MQFGPVSWERGPTGFRGRHEPEPILSHLVFPSSVVSGRATLVWRPRWVTWSVIGRARHITAH